MQNGYSFRRAFAGKPKAKIAQKRTTSTPRGILGRAQDLVVVKFEFVTL
jgi:hypothetical protein